MSLPNPEWWLCSALCISNKNGDSLVSRVVLVPIFYTGASCDITSSFSIAVNGTEFVFFKCSLFIVKELFNFEILGNFTFFCLSENVKFDQTWEDHVVLLQTVHKVMTATTYPYFSNQLNIQKVSLNYYAVS